MVNSIFDVVLLNIVIHVFIFHVVLKINAVSKDKTIFHVVLNINEDDSDEFIFHAIPQISVVSAFSNECIFMSTLIF